MNIMIIFLQVRHVNAARPKSALGSVGLRSLRAAGGRVGGGETYEFRNLLREGVIKYKHHRRPSCAHAHTHTPAPGSGESDAAAAALLS